jgi:carboxypeptidase T
MSLILKVTSSNPRAPLGQLLRLPLGLDVWEVKPDYLILRGVEAQADRLRQMGYGVDQLHLTERYLATFNAAAGGYHSAASLEADLRRLADARPEIAELNEIGRSVEGRPIWALRIGERRGSARKALFMGCHHAREWIAVEVPFLLAEHLVNSADESPVKEWLGQGEVWVAPMVNPDGHEHSRVSDRLWRKNRRRNPDGSVGVDPNRNYGYMWGTLNVPTSSHVPSDETYVGPRAFSEPETQAVRDLVTRERFDVVLTYHSYSQLILYPWGYTNEPVADPQDRELLAGLAGQMRQLIEGVHGKVYTPQQSSQLYPTAGDTTDWTYGAYGIPSFTIELRPRTVAEGGFLLPASQIRPTWEENKPAALDLIARALGAPQPARPALTAVAAAATVNLTLVRHGKPSGTNGDTPLGAEGEEQAEALGAMLKAARPAPDKVLTSPLLRARQTAEIIAREAGLGPPDVTDVLAGDFATADGAPGSFPRLVHDAVQQGGRHIVLVGHLPYMPEAVAWLAGGGNVRFPTEYGSAAHFQLRRAAEQAGGQLHWLVTADMLRAAAEQPVPG